MKKFFLSRPRDIVDTYGYSTGHKNKYKNNKATLRFPWANKTFTFYPQNPHKRNNKGLYENYWDQGCEITGINYLNPAQLEQLMTELKVYEEYQIRIARLECEYNAWLTGRYRKEADVKTNCDQLVFDAPSQIPNRLRCVHHEGENLSKGQSRASSWTQYYTNKTTLDAFRSRITQLEADIAYEKEQAVNLETERDRRGITQRDMQILYPEAQAVMEELAPQASPADETEYELGEFTDVDGDGTNDNSGMTDQEKRYWLYAGIGITVLGLASFIASKKIK